MDWCNLSVQKGLRGRTCGNVPCRRQCQPPKQSLKFLNNVHRYLTFLDIYNHKAKCAILFPNRTPMLLKREEKPSVITPFFFYKISLVITFHEETL